MPIIYSTKALLPRESLDFYPTEQRFADYVVQNLPEIVSVDTRDILDPGAGTGVWGKAFDSGSNITGVEINSKMPKIGVYSNWYTADYLAEKLPLSPSLVIGNPPFKYAEEFLVRSLEYVSNGGNVIFLLRMAFLESAKRYKQFYSVGLNPKKSIWCSTAH